MGWRTESAALLGWAVGVVASIQAYDKMTPYDLIQPLADVSIRERPVRLRAPEELDRAQTEAEKWHWRARQVEGYFRDPSVDALTGKAAEKRKQTIRRALGETISLFGKRYEDLTFREWSIARSIASERHHALNWLWDGGPWDDVVTDT